VNIYLVVSELLPATDLACGPYRIAELVRAESASQARYLAWKRDECASLWLDDIRNMPKMSCALRAKDVEGEAGIVSDDPELEHLWEGEICLAQL